MRTPRDAGYVPYPVAGHRCDGCAMFRPPDHCSLVTGEISPEGSCGYWEPRTVKSVAKSFDQLIKGEPGAGDVHVSTALGNQVPRRRRYKPFSAFVSGGPKKTQDGPSTFGPMPVITATTKRYATVSDLPTAVTDKLRGKKARQWMHVFNSVYDAHADLPKKDRESRAFAGAWSAVGKQLGTPTAPPFPTDLGFMSRLSGPQVPSFLWALTHRDDLPKAKVPMDSLVAIQDRVNPADVARDEEEPPTQRPTIVRLHGTNYIADGHDRLSARLLAGKKNAKVRLHDIDNPVDPEAVKKWDEARTPAFEIPFEIKKVDPDQRMIFGWASIVTKDGRLVVDHQNDVISTDELEKAFYDYVLYSRGQGHMHSKMGVGRLIECMMFTKQKQDVLKIVVRDEDGDQIEGAWVGYYVDDDDVWAAHKRHELPAFSIGGAAVPIEMEI